MRKILFPIIACLLLFLTTACAPPVKDRFFWPPPPLEPQVEFIKTYQTTKDMLEGWLPNMVYELTGGNSEMLRQPVSVSGDNKGKIYLSDSVLEKIFVFDFDEKTLSLYGNRTKLELPYGLSHDSKGNLYVVERKGGRVQVFNRNQENLFSFGKGELNEPARIAIDEERGRIYVADYKDHQIKVFSLDGRFIQVIGGEKGVRSGIEGEFNRPNGMAVDRTGDLYVCDQLNARIQVFDSTGALLRVFGTRSNQINDFESPTEIEFDKFGNLWIVDGRKGAIITYSVTPEFRFLFATYGADQEKNGFYSFKTPMDIFIDKDSRIYIPDSMPRRMSVLQYLDKTYLSNSPIPDDWMQRKDVLEIWYRDSGMDPPKKE